ncbi:hypothetical protein MMC10_008961 [Thelotrema lepadinum]|nr:hypothetical protein [Thelotrema lepadinum]
MTFTYEGRIEQRTRTWLRKVWIFRRSEPEERGSATVEEERRQLAALDVQRLRRERRLEEYRRSQPDAIDPQAHFSDPPSSGTSTNDEQQARDLT